MASSDKACSGDHDDLGDPEDLGDPSDLGDPEGLGDPEETTDDFDSTRVAPIKPSARIETAKCKQRAMMRQAVYEADKMAEPNAVRRFLTIVVSELDQIYKYYNLGKSCIGKGSYCIHVRPDTIEHRILTRNIWGAYRTNDYIYTLCDTCFQIDFTVFENTPSNGETCTYHRFNVTPCNGLFVMCKECDLNLDSYTLLGAA